MAFYAYCLLRLNPDEPWPVMQGISEHPVFPLRCGKYAMLLSRLERHFPFTPRSIVEHGQVIAHAFESHTVLPLRFATFFQSEKQIANVIQENQGQLLEAFCRLRGKSEMRLKLLFQAGALDAAAPESKVFRSGSPVAYACAKASEMPLDSGNQEMAHQMAARMGQVFQPLEQQISCRMLPKSEMVVDCAHLVESRNVDAYQKLHSAASEQVKNCELRISGPWPPYHFLPPAMRLPAASVAPLRKLATVGSN